MTVNKCVDVCYSFVQNPFFQCPVLKKVQDANNEKPRPNNGAFFICKRSSLCVGLNPHTIPIHRDSALSGLDDIFVNT
jgi:hypothetical protein